MSIANPVTTTGALGRRAGVSGQRIRDLIAAGRIVAFRDATDRWLILESEAARFLAEYKAERQRRRHEPRVAG